MTDMQRPEYVRLGSTGLKVSVPILGAMSIGSSKWLEWVLDEKESFEFLKAAWDRGFNTIDTANVYSNGASEVVIGKFIKEYKIPRNQILIFTKCCGMVHEDLAIDANTDPALRQDRSFVNQYGLSRAAIFNAVEASLARLGTTYIDLLQIHRFDPETPVEETMKALHDLVQSGKVRYIGASSMRCWEFARMNEVADKYGWTRFVSMQNEYSLLYREEEREMLKYCQFHGISVIPWAPLATGVLTRPVGHETPRSNNTPQAYKRDLTETDKTIINRVEEVAKKRGKTMAQIALAWVAAKITSPIVGISSIQRLEEAIIQFKLTEEELRYLEEPYVPKPVRGHA